jgi:hypothetical protein
MSIFTHAVSPRSLLPPPLVEALSRLVLRPVKRPTAGEVERVLKAMAALSPDLVVRAGREIASVARLDARPSRGGPSLMRFFRPPLSDADLLASHPDLAWLFLFHHGGYVRQAALDAISTPPASPFFFAAIAWRLNDWVEPVRAAAARCAARVLHATAPEVAAGSALFLLDRLPSWGRWTNEQRALDEAFAKPEVAAVLADHLREDHTGALGACLRHALRYPSMDAHLPRLAAEAVQPAVRAVSLRCLLARRASWPDGFAWMWIDKASGLSKRVPRFGLRAIPVSAPIAELITQGAHDRSAVVRKVVAEALMEVQPQPANAEAVIARLASDCSAAVRSRADFLMRQRGKALP